MDSNPADRNPNPQRGTRTHPHVGGLPNTPETSMPSAPSACTAACGRTGTHELADVAMLHHVCGRRCCQSIRRGISLLLISRQTRPDGNHIRPDHAQHAQTHTPDDHPPFHRPAPCRRSVIAAEGGKRGQFAGTPAPSCSCVSAAPASPADPIERATAEHRGSGLANGSGFLPEGSPNPAPRGQTLPREAPRLGYRRG